MSAILKISRENLKSYEDELLYLLASGNTILEFCLLAQIEYENNKNDLENIKLKKYLKRMKNITNALYKLRNK